MIDWLEGQPRARLVRLGIDPDQMDDHAFYPRVALGEYFLDQFNDLIDEAQKRGIGIEVATSCRVTDIRAEDDGLHLSIEPRHGEACERVYDRVVLATGHQWPEEPEVRPGYFLSPWPATALQRIPPVSVGIRGSSLTAIDAAVALAVAHGDRDRVGHSALSGLERLAQESRHCRCAACRKPLGNCGKNAGLSNEKFAGATLRKPASEYRMR